MNKNFISKVLALAFAFFPLMTLAQTTHNVSAGSYYYTDIYETVYEGDQVCWFNDGGYHDVNFSGYGNPQEIVDQYLPPNSGGDLGCVTFNSAGSFTYDCSIGNHAANGMVATILVAENDNLNLVPSVAISDCSDFTSGPNAWPYVLEATIIADGVASQASQTYTMNITSLPTAGANFRVYKTVANGNDYFGNPVALTLGENSITVAAVAFDRTVKFQFSS